MSNDKLQPLLHITYPIDWAKIDQTLLGEAIDEGLRLGKERVAKLEGMPMDEVSYDSFIDALEHCSDELDYVWGITHHLAGVDDSELIRKTVEEAMPKVSEFSSKVEQSVPLYERVKAVAQSDEFATLEPIKKRNVEETLKAFERSGASLDEDKKKELTQIDKDLGLLKHNYEKNVLDATNAYEIIVSEQEAKTDLAGMPQSDLAVAQESAQSVGKDGYRFTLQRPSLNALLTYSPNRELREKMWKAHNNMCSSGDYNNLPIVPKLLELRQRKAHLLGYENYAAYVVEQRMLNSPKKIQDFLSTLFDKARPMAEADFDKIAKFKAAQGDSTSLEPWDLAYYMEKLMQEELGLSTEMLRPYFEFESSLKSIFSLCETIYGVRFQKVEDHKAWHDDVDYYEMFDKESGRLIAGFYTDFFPRKQKRQGAWMDAVHIGEPQADGTLSPHIGFIGGSNFMPPTANKPSLLSHDDLTTLYHEFGHLLHLMMTTVTIPSLAATNVAWDFVELPSQLMENYCFDRDYLRGFAKHYESGQTLSDELIEKLRQSQCFMEGYACDRQLNFGHLDMYLHTTDANAFTPDNIEDKVNDEALAKFKLPYTTKVRPQLRTFTHLFGGGYAAGYYSYKWSEILEADIWEKFEQDGITNPETGQAWREGIISRGNSEDAMELFKKYRGREPKLDAYLKRLTGQK